MSKLLTYWRAKPKTIPETILHLSYKLKVDSMPEGPKRTATLRLGLNYLYRYAMLIVLAEYLLEGKESQQPSFNDWLEQKREVSRILARQTLD